MRGEKTKHYRSCLVDVDLTESDVGRLREQDDRVFVQRRRPGCATYPFEVHFAPVEHRMTLNDPWYDLVGDGRKRYEGRRCTPKTRAIRTGDTIEFSHHSLPPFRKTVGGVRWFPSFRSALVTLGIDDVLPGVEAVDEGVEIYTRFVSEETQRREGVLIFEIVAM